jgi:hypothetical protein
MDRLGKLAIKDPHRPQRNLEQPMFAGSFHQLHHSAAAVNLHDYEGLASTFNANQLTGSRDPAGEEIRFDDDA